VKKIRNQLWKLSWFINNYRNIQPGVRFIPPVFQGPVVYQADGLMTSNNCDFIHEPRFKAAYAAAAATNPWDGFDMPWRMYIVCWFANWVKGLPGQFVECGVNTGAYSRAILEYIDFKALNKTFYLLDTYEGLVPQQITEKEHNAGIGSYLHTYKNVYEQVMETFKYFPVKIIKGAIPATLPQCDAREICYLSIDMNVIEPEIAAINYFWDKVVKGGVIILDDYGFPKHIGQKLAFDKFAKDKNVEILSLPTGQAIIFKP